MLSLRHANKLLPIAIMRQLYYTHVYPHLTYAIAIWGTDNPRKAYIQPLIRAHKKIIRLTANLPPRTHATPLMQKLRILDITSLYVQRVRLEMYPFIKHKHTIDLPEHNHIYTLVSQIHSYPTRHAKQRYYYNQTHTTIPRVESTTITLNISIGNTQRYGTLFLETFVV